jgi:sugar phosphate isomerase/epimerase
VRQEDRAAPAFARWQQETAMALQQVCDVAGDGRRVAVENLEGYPPDFVTPVVEHTAAGRCFDIGHLWLDGVDPLPHLAAALPRLQVVHLHGVRPLRGTAEAASTGLAGGASGAAAGDLAQDSRDHNSLAHADPLQLDAVISALIAAQFAGVLCLEIFGEDDFWSSLAALEASVRRVHLEKGATE